jgi:agmatinase
MGKNNEPMTPGRKISLPVIYGDTPSFLGCPVIRSRDEVKGYDVAVMGVPWEGTITWGTYSGCELAPKTIRHAAARYGGFLPEYEIDIFDHLKVGDYGDVIVHPSDPARTMKSVEEKATDIYAASALPVSIGGDHSYTPEIVKALTHHTAGKVGVIHFDAHLDNLESFGSDGGSPMWTLYPDPPAARRQKDEHGSRRNPGPRNAPSQRWPSPSRSGRVSPSSRSRAWHRAGHCRGVGDRPRWDGGCLRHRLQRRHRSSSPGGPPDFDGLSPPTLLLPEDARHAGVQRPRLRGGLSAPGPQRFLVAPRRLGDRARPRRDGHGKGGLEGHLLDEGGRGRDRAGGPQVSTADELRQFIASSLMTGRESVELKDDLSLIEAGVLDSIGIVQLLTFIEERLHVRVPEGEVVPEHFETIGQMVRLVDALPRNA